MLFFRLKSLLIFRFVNRSIYLSSSNRIVGGTIPCVRPQAGHFAPDTFISERLFKTKSAPSSFTCLPCVLFSLSSWFQSTDRHRLQQKGSLMLQWWKNLVQNDMKCINFCIPRSQQRRCRPLPSWVQSCVRPARTLRQPAAQRHKVHTHFFILMAAAFCFQRWTKILQNVFRSAEMANPIGCITWMSSPTTCTVASACMDLCHWWWPTNRTGLLVCFGWMRQRLL